MKSDTACLLIHGFGGSAFEVLPLAYHLRDKGYHVVCTSLKGHTGKRRDLYLASYSQWIESAEKDLNNLLNRFSNVIVVGFSMGGLIAANLAIKYPAIKAMVTLNTPIYYWDFKRIYLNILKDIKKKNMHHIKYYLNSTVKFPLPALINFKILLSKTKKLFNQIRCPIFVVQGLMDDTVHQKSAQFIIESVLSNKKTIKYYKRADHLICHSSDKEMMFSDIYYFIEYVKGISG